MKNGRHRTIRETLSEAAPGDSLLDPNNISRPLTWPYKMKAELEGQITLGGLHMIHERNNLKTCGPIMAQGGIQAMETMVFTIDHINKQPWWIRNVTLGEYLPLLF